MEGLKDSPLAALLERNRDRCNARFTAAARDGARMSREDFFAHLLGPFRRIVEAVAASAPASLDPTFEALYDLSVDLFARSILGPSSHFPQVNAVWSDIMPAAARVLPAAPRRVAAALTNMAYRVANDSPVAAAAWAKDALRVAPLCASPDELLNSCLVLAWRSGLPHYRDSAMGLWRNLPAPLRCATLALPADGQAEALEEVAKRLRNPWFRPDDQESVKPGIRLARLAGGFRGYGGPFIEPPLLTVEGDTIYAYDGEVCCRLHADAFGCLLRPVRAAPEGRRSGGKSSLKISADGTVSVGNLKASMPELANPQSKAALVHTLAVTLPQSHYVYVIGITGQEFDGGN